MLLCIGHGSFCDDSSNYERELSIIIESVKEHYVTNKLVQL